MTRMQSSTGLAIDLAAPDLSAIDVELDLAGPLSRLACFAGHRAEESGAALPPPYTVAQHCVVGADALLEETGDVVAALAFLAHDAHEALIGDLTTPVALALDHWAEAAMRITGGEAFVRAVRAAIGCGVVRAAIGGLKGGLDREIHRLAGLPHPLPATIAQAVGEMDQRMLDLERRLILGRRLRNATVDDLWGATARARPVRVHGALVAWTQRKARSEWMRRWEAWSGGAPAIREFVPLRPLAHAAPIECERMPS